MDNNNDFEQQFKQNLKTTAAPAPVVAPSTSISNSKLPLVIAIALAAITLVESIVLIITLSNYFAIINGGEEINEEQFTDENISNEYYVFDEDYNLTAVGLTCTAEDGSSYVLSTDNKYEQYNGAGSLAVSGSYTITNNSLISLSGSNKVLYYDGFDMADGLTIYTCKETTTEANANDSTAE